MTGWSALARPLPQWFAEAPLGIFIHWGAYSVPAWAEPIGALGTIDQTTWFAHNPYAEWYSNTIRIDGSPAQRHHRSVHGGRPYDEFLDRWTAARFDPSSWADLFAAAGADYVIPTTKHHDGIALWDAPGTGTRNTVHRGPRRDLIGEIAAAVVRRGLRFGVYYSGGLDWHARPGPPHTRDIEAGDRPRDAGYARYAYDHVRDLIDRYSPSVLWNDIDWPDEGKHFGPYGLGALLRHYYAAVPDGVVNDRWGAGTHHDYATSEYEHLRGSETEAVWENCRGVGFSFGYNSVEGPEQSLTGGETARHLADVVSRGGRLLLNVGPTADGTLPPLQHRALTDLGTWMAYAKFHLAGATPLTDAPAADGDTWIRWVAFPDRYVAFADPDAARDAPFGRGARADGDAPAAHDARDRGDGLVTIACPPGADPTRAHLAGAGQIVRRGPVLTVSAPADRPGPLVVVLPKET